MLKKTFLLVILDGFGISSPSPFNAITQAKTPTWNTLWENYPHTLLEASGLCVGLPEGQIGNSEVGHTTIAAGRTVYQDLTTIDQAITTGELQKNTVFQTMITLGKTQAIHLMGLLSPGGVHSHEDHLFSLLPRLVDGGCTRLYLHAFLDGRDVPPKSAEHSLQKLSDLCQRYPQIQIASLMGRYYAMDRDQRLERTELAYHTLTTGQAPFQARTLQEALAQAYARGETDEFVQPTWINHAPCIQDHDIVFFTNFRADRTRQLSRMLLKGDLKLTAFFSMTQYAEDIKTQILFPPTSLKNMLGDYLSSLGKTQLRLAETEKYAHVTFFFNGGKENPLPGEARILIPSPKVSTYDLQPEMSAHELTAALVNAIQSRAYDFIVCNFANPDMVGHTGSLPATIKAIECIDTCLNNIFSALKKVQGEMLITADHGNADCMFDEAHTQPHTAHTTSLVPLLYVGRKAKVLGTEGSLADIAPTLLTLMQLPIPQEMTGKALFQIEGNAS